jgi:hypothetical protein
MALEARNNRPKKSTLVRSGSASETRNIMRFCSTILTSILALLILSGCLFIPVPIGMAYQKPERSVTPQEETTSPSNPDLKLAAKKKHLDNAKEKQKRTECKEQAEKLLSHEDRRAYMKECMSKER